MYCKPSPLQSNSHRFDTKNIDPNLPVCILDSLKVMHQNLISKIVPFENTFALSQKWVKRFHITTMYQFWDSTPTTTGINEHFLIVSSKSFQTLDLHEWTMYVGYFSNESTRTWSFSRLNWKLKHLVCFIEIVLFLFGTKSHFESGFTIIYDHLPQR